MPGGTTPILIWRASVSFPHLVPALVELAFVPVAPILGHLKRTVRADGGVVDKKWLVGCERMLGSYPLDALVGDICAGIVIGIGMYIYPVHVVVNDRMEEISLPSHEAVEPLKTAVHGPAVERPDDTGFPGPQLVTLPEHGGAVTVESQDFGQHRNAGGTHRGVPREGGGNFRDHAKVCAMTVAAGEQGHAAWRT